jgi:hypothetical protein
MITTPQSPPANTAPPAKKERVMQDFSLPDGEVMTETLANKGLTVSSENKEALKKLIAKGIQGQSPTGVQPGEKQGILEGLGGMWGGLLDGAGKFLMTAFVFVSELFSNKFNFGKSWEKAQDYMASRDTGSQMSKVLGHIRDAMPFGQDGLEYTHPSGATPRDYERMQATRNEQIEATRAVDKIHKSKRNSANYDEALERRKVADDAMETLDAQNKSRFGKSSEELWNDFVAHKKQLMHATASEMGRVAQANGLKDTPTDSNTMLGAWAHSAAVKDLATLPENSRHRTSDTPYRTPVLDMALANRPKSPMRFEASETSTGEAKPPPATPLTPDYSSRDLF